MRRNIQKPKFKEKPMFVWTPIQGVQTSNGNYLFFRKSVKSRNVFWYNTKKVRPTSDGLYYMPPKFHMTMAWVYVPSENKLLPVKDPVWGDAKTYALPQVRIIDEASIGYAIEQLHNAMNKRTRIKRKRQ